MRIKFAALLVLLGCLAISCERSAPAPQTGELRIVSLTPSLTKMLIDLGERGRIVGVGQYDSLAPQAATVVGNYVEVDIERLLSVRPTHVLTMAGKEGVPTRLQNLADKGYFELSVYPLPLSIEDVMAILHDPQKDADLGRVLGKPDEAAELARAMSDELELVRLAVAGLHEPRVLMVIALNPVMASGPGTVNDELLKLAGGVNAAEKSVVTAPTYDREAIIAMQPEVILLFLPNDPPLSANDERLRIFEGLPIPAVEHDRIVLLNDPLIVLPSTSMSQTLRSMAEAIHDGVELEGDKP